MKNKSRKEHILEQGEIMKKDFPNLKDDIDILVSKMLEDLDNIVPQRGCPCGSIYCGGRTPTSPFDIKCKDLK